MTRLGRYFLPDQPLHAIQRGNNRAPVFFADDDYRFYLDTLELAAERAQVAIHGYVLMTNRVHLLATPSDEAGVPRLMQLLGARYVRNLNRTYRRSGTLWEGRYRATPIEAESYFIACMRYIELNPVRARMCAAPGDYPWSSYRHHAEGMPGRALSDHPIYRALGADDGSRQAAYRALFDDVLPEAFIAELRAATNGGWALGSEAFKETVACMAQRRATPLPAGRPAIEQSRDARQGDLLS
jgi:putative transposase